MLLRTVGALCAETSYSHTETTLIAKVNQRRGMVFHGPTTKVICLETWVLRIRGNVY